MLTRKLIFIESPVTTLPSRSTGPRYRADLPGQFSFDSTGPIFVVGASPTAQTHPLVKVRFYPCWGCSACVVKTPLPPFGLSGGLGSSVFNQPFSPIFTNFVSAGCVRPALAPCLYKTGALTVRRRLLPRRRIGHDGTLTARARGGRRCSVAGRASVACCRPASDAGRQMLQAWHGTTRCCGLPTRPLMMKLVCLFLQKRVSSPQRVSTGARCSQIQACTKTKRMNGAVDTTSKVLVAQVQSLVGGNDCIKCYIPTLKVPCVIM